MNDDDLIRVLDRRADEAFPPADLLASLDRRYRRWRTRTATLAGTVAVLVVTALVATIAAIETGRPGGAEPADVRPLRIPFKVPTKLVDTAPVTSVFPGATFRVPKETPDHLSYTFVAPIDRTHLLTWIDERNSQYSDFASYDLTTRTFGPNLSRIRLGMGAGFAYNERYWVWGSNQDTTEVISKVALATGRVTTVATVPLGTTDRYAGWYADDKWVYSSNEFGVERLSLDGGSFQPVSGLEGMQLRDDSPWAAQTAGAPAGAPAQTGSPQIFTTLGSVDTELRNVETGQVVHITVPADAMGLICAPIICLGFDGSRSFIQRPDGTDRVRLPYVPLTLGNYLDQPWHLLCTSGGALVVSGSTSQVFLDPYTGVYAATGLRADDVYPSGVGFLPDAFGGADLFATNALYAGWSTSDEVFPGENYTNTNPDTILLPGLLTGP